MPDPNYIDPWAGTEYEGTGGPFILPPDYGTGGTGGTGGTTTNTAPVVGNSNCFPFTFPTAHSLTPSNIAVGSDGYATNVGYVLYGRCLVNEMITGINAYEQAMDGWRDTNWLAKSALATDVVNLSSGFRAQMLYGMAAEGAPGVTTSYISNVPTKQDQRDKLTELAAAAKSLLEDNEIDPTQNAQYAAGLSAAMGGGHNSATAIKDNITFEQKLQAKQLALATYAQAIDAYYKTYTATATQLGMGANQAGIATSASIPTVVPFESQLASDIFANWQDVKNTGQMRDQQIRQTINGARAMAAFFNTSQSWVNNPNILSNYNGETASAVFGIRSQYQAARTY